MGLNATKSQILDSIIETIDEQERRRTPRAPEHIERFLGDVAADPKPESLDSERLAYDEADESYPQG